MCKTLTLPQDAQYLGFFDYGKDGDNLPYHKWYSPSTNKYYYSYEV